MMSRDDVLQIFVFSMLLSAFLGIFRLFVSNRARSGRPISPTSRVLTTALAGFLCTFGALYGRSALGAVLFVSAFTAFIAGAVASTLGSTDYLASFHPSGWTSPFRVITPLPAGNDARSGRTPAWLRLVDVIAALILIANLLILIPRLYDFLSGDIEGSYLFLRTVVELPITLAILLYLTWRSSHPSGA